MMKQLQNPIRFLHGQPIKFKGVIFDHKGIAENKRAVEFNSAALLFR